MENDILVSVITCLYNCPPNLFEKCIEGLLNQTFKDFEVLIVNDGSDKYLEENVKIIKSLNDDRFKYFDTEHTGKSQTLNFAISKAQGKYIAINDSDDMSFPQRLEYQYNFLESNPNYDVISNAMISDVTKTIFPFNGESCDVEPGHVHYKANHPSMMFNRHKVLQAVPFLFEQIYDSMEDNVFNHIMFWCGKLKFRYDNNILVQYSERNSEAAHKENLYGYKKEGAFKLFYRTFYADEFHKNAEFTCFLLVNQNWKDEIEKTIINIRYTSNNVNIVLICYNNVQLDTNYYNMYDVRIFNAQTYIDALNKALFECDTEYLMIISKPIRFYCHNWDMYAIRNFKSIYHYDLVQPNLIGIDKIDRDNYYNENGKINDYKLRYGNNLILLDKQMTEQRNNLNMYSEYISTADIPILDDDLIFITTKTDMQKINYAAGYSDNLLINVYLSLKEYLIGKSVCIDTDIKCGVINIPISKYPELEYNFRYYSNLWFLANFFLNETKFLYEKIIYENLNIEDAKYIINKSINFDDFNINKNIFYQNKIFDMSYFLKNINLKYNVTYYAN